jgi:hypothetical protein
LNSGPPFPTESSKVDESGTMVRLSGTVFLRGAPKTLMETESLILLNGHIMSRLQRALSSGREWPNALYLIRRQSPWLRHQSIKDNILFGYPFDEEQYNVFLDCCVLKPDLEMLEDGDATEIGAGYTFSSTYWLILY